LLEACAIGFVIQASFNFTLYNAKPKAGFALFWVVWYTTVNYGYTKRDGYKPIKT